MTTQLPFSTGILLPLRRNQGCSLQAEEPLYEGQVQTAGAQSLSRSESSAYHSRHESQGFPELAAYRMLSAEAEGRAKLGTKSSS